MWFRPPNLIFQVLPRPDPAMIPGTALAQSSNEAPVAESSANDAVCLYDDEISNETTAGGVSPADWAVVHNPGLGVGGGGWHVGLYHWL